MNQPDPTENQVNHLSTSGPAHGKGRKHTSSANGAAQRGQNHGSRPSRGLRSQSNIRQGGQVTKSSPVGRQLAKQPTAMRCGFNMHNSRDGACPALQQTYHECGRKGHLTRKCRTQVIHAVNVGQDQGHNEDCIFMIAENVPHDSVCVSDDVSIDSLY